MRKGCLHQVQWRAQTPYPNLPPSGGTEVLNDEVLNETSFMKRTIQFLLIAALLVICSRNNSAQAATRVSFPYTPIGVASWPWWIAKEAGYYEKHGLDVDMIYVGASPVIVQAMLGGQAGIGAGGGTPLVTNVLQGGDVVQVATLIPYAIQSLIVRPEIKSTKDLV